MTNLPLYGVGACPSHSGAVGSIPTSGPRRPSVFLLIIDRQPERPALSGGSAC